MSALWIVGLIIASNFAIFLGSLVWMRRQVKRVAAERDREYRALFRLDPLPPPGEVVQILVEEGGGLPSEFAARHYPHLGWIDASTLITVEDEVVGWRRHPFRSKPVGRTRLSPEQLDAELARLTSDDPEG